MLYSFRSQAVDEERTKLVGECLIVQQCYLIHFMFFTIGWLTGVWPIQSHVICHPENYFWNTHPFNSPLSRTTWVSRYQKGKTNLDFTEARDSEWQWHQLGHMQVCTLLQTDNHANTSLLSFLQAGCPYCRLTNSVKYDTIRDAILNEIKNLHE